MGIVHRCLPSTRFSLRRTRSHVVLPSSWHYHRSPRKFPLCATSKTEETVGRSTFLHVKGGRLSSSFHKSTVAPAVHARVYGVPPREPSPLLLRGRRLVTSRAIGLIQLYSTTPQAVIAADGSALSIGSATASDPSIHDSMESTVVNRVDKADNRVLLSFYRFVPLERLPRLKREMDESWGDLDVLGRVYIAREGVNGMISVPRDRFDELRECIDNTQGLKDLYLNIYKTTPIGVPTPACSSADPIGPASTSSTASPPTASPSLLSHTEAQNPSSTPTSPSPSTTIHHHLHPSSSELGLLVGSKRPCKPNTRTNRPPADSVTAEGPTSATGESQAARALNQIDVGFHKLSVRIRPQILNDACDITLEDIDNLTPNQLAAKEWNALISRHEENAIVVDVRNAYESQVGRFDHAVCPDVVTFRESLDIIKDEIVKKRDSWKQRKAADGSASGTAADAEEPPVLMYCTGGIRCVKASAYLAKEGISSNVYMLKGGIVTYAREVENSDGVLETRFRGKNFMFADTNLGSRITNDVLSTCDQCGSVSDRHQNCLNITCHRLFIQCSKCAGRHNGMCSDSCTADDHKMKSMTPEEAKRFRSEKGPATFSLSHRRPAPGEILVDRTAAD